MTSQLSLGARLAVLCVAILWQAEGDVCTASTEEAASGSVLLQVRPIHRRKDTPRVVVANAVGSLPAYRTLIQTEPVGVGSIIDKRWYHELMHRRRRTSPTISPPVERPPYVLNSGAIAGEMVPGGPELLAASTNMSGRGDGIVDAEIENVENYFRRNEVKKYGGTVGQPVGEPEDAFRYHASEDDGRATDDRLDSVQERHSENDDNHIDNELDNLQKYLWNRTQHLNGLLQNHQDGFTERQSRQLGKLAGAHRHIANDVKAKSNLHQNDTSPNASELQASESVSRHSHRPNLGHKRKANGMTEGAVMNTVPGLDRVVSAVLDTVVKGYSPEQRPSQRRDAARSTTTLPDRAAPVQTIVDAVQPKTTTKKPRK